MTKEWQDIIDRYIRNELPEEEKQTFRELMKSEPGFRYQLLITRQLVDELERINEQEVIAELKNNKKINPGRWAVGISIAVAACLLFFVYIGHQPRFDAEELYRLNYSPMAYRADYTRGSNTVLSIPQKKDIQKAFELYDSKRYSEVPPLLEPIIQSVDTTYVPESVFFYNAISRIETGDTEQAFETLRYLAENGEEFRADSKWYLALLYLHKDMRKHAIRVLEELAEMNAYGEKATRLLEGVRQRKVFDN